eukprot:3785159-Rhodomonas_salina.1
MSASRWLRPSKLGEADWLPCAVHTTKGREVTCSNLRAYHIRSCHTDYRSFTPVHGAAIMMQTLYNCTSNPGYYPQLSQHSTCAVPIATNVVLPSQDGGFLSLISRRRHREECAQD